MAQAKAIAAGEILPFLPKYPDSLGAPFQANWNDYPSVEEAVFAWYGLLTWCFGLFLGSNLTVLSASLFAAASFFFVCMQLRYHPVVSASGAVLFSLSRYAFVRGLEHFPLTFYWHIPLILLLIHWCIQGEPLPTKGKKLIFCLVVPFLTGIQNPYYSGIFLQFVGLAAFVNLMRWKSWRHAHLPFLIGAILLAAFILANLDTYYHRWSQGSNPAAVARNYADLELYALKPIELLLPHVHSNSAFASWARRSYYEKAQFLGEASSPYLGLVGIIGLALLFWTVTKGIALRDWNRIPNHLWAILWILGFSVVGGINGLAGAFGFILFRSSNRYSIVILAIILLFLVRQLTIAARRASSVTVCLAAAVFTLFGLWDQIPPQDIGAIAATRSRLQADAEFVRQIEAQLSPSAMVFQLPVMDFPEMPPINAMADYEHFRPFLHSRDLRFSYGSNKGRPRENWQRQAQHLGAAELVPLLEAYGFSAILINRKGYEDRAVSLLKGLENMGRRQVLADSADLICIGLTPSEQADLAPEFVTGWHDREGEAQHWRWSSGDATILLHNRGNQPKSVVLQFQLGTLRARNMQIFFHGSQIYSTSLPADTTSSEIGLSVLLLPGRNELRLTSDVAAELPPNGDPRKLAFQLNNFSVLDATEVR